MAEQARFCDECGARLERSSSKFCASCGTEIPSPSGQQRTEATNADVLQEMRTQETRRQEETWIAGTRYKDKGQPLRLLLGCGGFVVLLAIVFGVCTAVVT